MWGREQAIHRAKLERIAARGSTGIPAGARGQASKREMFNQDDQERFFKNKQRIHAYKEHVKQQQIEKDNQKLLKKLVEISAGKKNSLNLPAGLQKSSSVQVIEFKTRSLHFNTRKAELERIERENQKIAKKIFGLKSDLNKDKFRADF